MRVSPYGTGSSGTASIRMTRCGGGSEYGGRPVGSIQFRTCRSGCGQSGTDTVRSVRPATRLIGDFASARGMGWAPTGEIRRVCLCITIQSMGVLSGPEPGWFSGRVHWPPHGLVGV